MIVPCPCLGCSAHVLTAFQRQPIRSVVSGVELPAKDPPVVEWLILACQGAKRGPGWSPPSELPSGLRPELELHTQCRRLNLELTLTLLLALHNIDTTAASGPLPSPHHRQRGTSRTLATARMHTDNQVHRGRFQTCASVEEARSKSLQQVQVMLYV